MGIFRLNLKSKNVASQDDAKKKLAEVEDALQELHSDHDLRKSKSGRRQYNALIQEQRRLKNLIRSLEVQAPKKSSASSTRRVCRQHLIQGADLITTRKVLT
jgi:aspartate oxidase